MSLKINTEGLSWTELKSRFKREHSSWAAMRTRCNNAKSDYYSSYGGKGIRVEDGWDQPGRLGLAKFLEDMGERPDGTSLERKDISKNYSRENCIWGTGAEQCFNRGLLPSNKSGVPGLFWVSKNNTWQIGISKEGSSFVLGYSPDLFEAACVRKSWELRLYPRQFNLCETPVTLTQGMVDVYRYQMTHNLSCVDILTILCEYVKRDPERGAAALARRFNVGKALVKSLVAQKVCMEDVVSLCLAMNINLDALRKAKVNGKLYEFDN